MRTLTLARMGRALLLAAAVIMLPQLASAQLPVTTKELKIQDTDASAGVSLKVADMGTTNYTLTLPAAVGGKGSFLYANTTDGGLAWTDVSSIGNGFYPRWDASVGGGSIVWTDPAGADNPNWSLTGNNLTSDGYRKLGFPAGDADISIETNGVRRIGIDNTGVVTVDATVDINGATTVDGATIALAGSTSTTINAAAGATNINTGANADAVAIGNTTTATMDLKAVATTIAGTSLGITAATTQTGAFNLAGTSSPLQVGGSAGTDKDVLVSKGTGATPEWQSITDAVGIRAKGRKSIAAGDITVAVTGLTGVTATDVITFSIEGGNAAIFGVITDRAGDGTGFTVSLSGAFSGTGGQLNYLVQTP